MGTIPVKISEHEKIPLKIKENSDKLNLGFNTKGIIIKPITITENGLYRAGGGAFNPVTVEVIPPLQAKEATPIEEVQEIIADEEYYGLNKVTIKAIPSDYVGSNIHRRDSNDLFADGPVIHVPEGYYELPIGEPDIKREGEDITILTIGPTLYPAMKAADLLQIMIPREQIHIRHLHFVSGWIDPIICDKK